jgi:iron complex transport system substrate-binding protein
MSTARARLSAALAVTTVLLVAGCGTADQTPSATAPASPGSTPAAATTYPLTVTQCGRTLTFDSAPQRVVVDGEVQAVPVFQMGAGDRVTHLFSHNAGSITSDYAVPAELTARLKAMPALIPGTDSSYPSKESFLAAKPDLVIEAYNGDAGNGDPKGTDALVKLGVPVFSLSPSCPGASLEASLQDTLALGRILDVQPAAQDLVDSWRARIAAAGAKARAAGAAGPTVFFLDGFGDNGEIYANTGAFARELVAAGGGRLVPENTTPDDIYSVSKEAVIAAKPDLVLTYTTEPPAEKVAKLWPIIDGSAAARSKTFTVVPYPDGSGSVEFVERLADAVAAFGSSSAPAPSS